MTCIQLTDEIIRKAARSLIENIAIKQDQFMFQSTPILSVDDAA